MAVNKKTPPRKTQKQPTPESRATTIKQVLIGGPLIGTRERRISSDFAGWDRFEPIITPEIQVSSHSTDRNQSQQQRFILLPHSRHIAVLAYQTGVQIATLVPYLDEEEANDSNDQIIIESVCLANYTRKVNQKTVHEVLEMDDSDDDDDEAVKVPTSTVVTYDEVVVLAGCRDGSLREFSLHNLGSCPHFNSIQCGSYHVVGPCQRPRRVISVTKGEPIMHVTSPRLRGVIDENGILAYIVIRTKDLETPVDANKVKTEQNMNIKVLRVLLPFYSDGDGGDSNKVSLLQKKEGDNIPRKWPVDNFRCRVGRDKAGGFMNTAPFRLLSVSRSGVNDCSVFIIVAQANTINIYLDSALKKREKILPMRYPMPPDNPITTIHISPNNEDIACGHFYGEISVMNGILTDLERYHKECTKATQQQGVNKPIDPRTNLITTKIHWHAHSVGTLVYDSMSSPLDPIFYSGGTESVLVTWQTGQGRSKPLHFLPRIALGAILHIACADKVDDRPSNGILIYSEDNSLQLLESHNKGRLWKIQGLAYNMKDAVENRSHQPTIEVDPLSKGSDGAQLVITGLPQAPGLMHWYDTIKGRLMASLEVAPFNKVSKTEADDYPMPSPSIVNYTFCDNGKELITIDETPTENTFVGAYDPRGNEGSYGVVTTIRFWAWNDTPLSTHESTARNPYTMTAAMSFPHGPKHLVSALASSKDGKSACTVSNDEKAFRLWKRVLIEDEEANRRIPTWTCAYKVTIPAGFSNHPTRRNGVAFSEDGSTLALSFGNMVTLWDCEEARFLTSVRHLEGAVAVIDSVQFISIGTLKVVLLIKSDVGVSVQSPFGSRSSFKGWSWGVPWGTKRATISSVEYLESESCIAMTLYDFKEERSRLIIVDASTGNPRSGGNGALALLDGIEGRVVSLSASEKPVSVSLWDQGTDDNDDRGMRLYCLTDIGTLCLLTDMEDAEQDGEPAPNNVPLSAGPPTLSISGDKNRKRAPDRASIVQFGPVSKKSALEVFGLVSGTESKSSVPLTSELPLLSKNFVRAFVGRDLLKGKGL